MTESDRPSDQDIFYQYVADEIRGRYVESVLAPESKEQKVLGRPSSHLMAQFVATVNLAEEKIVDGLGADSDALEEFQERIGEIGLDNPRRLTKVRVRTLSSEIGDLQRRWENFDLSSITAEEMVSEQGFDSVVEDVKDTFKEYEDTPSPARENVISYIEWQMDHDYLITFAEEVFDRMLAERVIQFYILYQTLIEEKTIEILNNSIISEDYRSTQGTYEFLEDISQPEREQLLERTGSTLPHIVSKMAQNRRMRNSLVHSLHGESDFRMVEDAAEKIERCIDVLSELQHPEEDFEWR